MDTAQRFVENGYITCSYLTAKTFGLHEAILLEYLMGWGAAKDWRYRTAQQIEDDTCLTTQNQRTARAKLKSLGVLEEKVEGIPPVVHFRVNWDRALALMADAPDRTNKSILQNQQNVSAESTNQKGKINKSIMEGSQREESTEESVSKKLTLFSDESSAPTKPAPTKPAPTERDIIAAYCRCARLDAPANYPKAIGQAKALIKAGVTADDVPSLYDHADWGAGADLGKMLASVDAWRSKRNRPRPLHPLLQAKLDGWIREVGSTRPAPPSLQARLDEWQETVRAVEARNLPPDLKKRAASCLTEHIANDMPLLPLSPNLEADIAAWEGR